MASLRERLNEILPRVLPENPADPITGTDLIERLRKEEDLKEYRGATFRTHFSVMVSDPTSPIAKVDQGHGYYLRPAPERTDPNARYVQTMVADSTTDVDDGGRDNQLEEKFRSFFIRWAEAKNQFPIHIEHTTGARQKAGINKWKFPDVVLVDWTVGEVTDTGYRFSKDLLEVKRSLGEQPFVLTSAELKVEVTASSLRKVFFQCVSNSKWAHRAHLVIASAVTDELVANELRRLGASYGVSVLSMSITSLETLPSADEILKMPLSKLEELLKMPLDEMEAKSLAVGAPRDGLDWEHIRDLQSQHKDFKHLFAWISFCLERKGPYTVSEWHAKR